MRLTFRTFILALGAISVAATLSAQTTPDPTGHWEGAIVGPSGEEFRVAFDLGRNPDGKLKGTFSNVDQKVSGLPFSAVGLQGALLTIDLRTSGGGIRYDVAVISGSEPVCVIGAGPCGLLAAASLKKRGIPFQIVDAGRQPGGIWDIDAPGSPMYESAHFISSKTLSGFRDFPMPEDYPDYPGHRLILRYLRAYAERCRARPAFQRAAALESA